MVKIADVAEKLNLSIATVSNAFTGKGRMSEETRTMILNVAKEMGYVWTPRKNATSTKNYIVITESITLSFTSRMLSGIFEEAKAQGIDLSIYTMNITTENVDEPSMERLSAEINRIVEGISTPIAGAIYISRYVRMIEELFKKHCFPSVGLFCNREKGKAVVHYDDFQGTYIAVERLIKMGRTHIAMIGGPIDSISMLLRTNAYQKALIDHKMAYNPKLVYVLNWTKEGGYQMAKELLESGEKVDAIFTSNDFLAIGALEAIHEKGLDCPEDIALVGFDNMDFTQFTTPKISTVNPPFEEMGRHAVRNIIQLNAGFDVKEEILPCEFIGRETTKDAK